MKVCIVTGSRADYGMLEWPIKLMKEDPFFEVDILNIWGSTPSQAFDRASGWLLCDMVLVLGDRYEIFSATLAAHLRRIPISHIGGGDVTEGSYDDAMRDGISRMATYHFVTSTSAMARLTHMGYHNVHLVGSPGIDYIRNAPWRGPRPYSEPYVVVSYQAETIDGTAKISDVLEDLESEKRKKIIVIMPNPDLGSERIRETIMEFAKFYPNNIQWIESLPHGEFLNLIAHCEEFIGNSSAMLYEAPELGIKTRMIGKRQKGRTIPWGDGFASERIIKVLKYAC